MIAFKDEPCSRVGRHMVAFMKKDIAKKPKKKADEEKAGGQMKDAKDVAAAAAPEAHAAPASPAAPPPDPEMNEAIKAIESAMFSIKFYPVAVNEESKDEALRKLKTTYSKGNETVRQLALYMIHEELSASAELKFARNYEYYRGRNPNKDPTQLRMNVYRAMFNYSSSMEGLVELVRLLGHMEGEGPAKLLTHHYASLCTMENEAHHVLRNAIIDALGESGCPYALNALLDYARYTDNERIVQRLVVSLVKWDQKLDGLKVSDAQRAKLQARLREVMTKELGGSHYG